MQRIAHSSGPSVLPNHHHSIKHSLTTCSLYLCICAVAALSEKEAVVFMQRLAHLENNGVVTGSIRQRWQSTFLELLYTMCTTVQAPFVSPLMFAHIPNPFADLSAFCIAPPCVWLHV